ncbi:uncharacterized protein [Solanum lycopersicum]|uniref:uncharacterized protein n=1 Tax=Solanum lycopersicum TaxID=4081 RepID=UPI0037495957
MGGSNTSQAIEATNPPQHIENRQQSSVVVCTGYGYGESLPTIDQQMGEMNRLQEKDIPGIRLPNITDNRRNDEGVLRKQEADYNSNFPKITNNFNRTNPKNLTGKNDQVLGNPNNFPKQDQIQEPAPYTVIQTYADRLRYNQSKSGHECDCIIKQIDEESKKKEDLDKSKNKKDTTNNGKKELQGFDYRETGNREEDGQQQGYQGEKIQKNQQQEWGKQRRMNNQQQYGQNTNRAVAQQQQEQTCRTSIPTKYTYIDLDLVETEIFNNKSGSRLSKKKSDNIKKKQQQLSATGKNKESTRQDVYEVINSEDEWDPDNQSMYDFEDEGTKINQPHDTRLVPKNQTVWSQEIQDMADKHGLSHRGRKPDKQATQHQPSTSDTSSRTMTRSKSKGF